MRSCLRWLAQPIVQTALLLIWCGFFLGVAAVTNDWFLAVIFVTLLVALVLILRHELAQLQQRLQRQITVHIGCDASAIVEAIQQARTEVDRLGRAAGGH